ncbi:MAG: hypothetical protein ACHQU1_13095 [Gemmatimonadales bacterium]
MTESAIMIALRLVHIISGVLWVGAVYFLALFLVPSVRAAGPGGAQIMQELMKRRLPVYLAGLPGLAVLSGLTMYLRASMLTHWQFPHTPQGTALAIGGTFALIGMIIGGAVTGRTAEALTNLGARIQLAGGSPSPEQMQDVQRLQAKLQTSSRLVAAILFVTLCMMASARYL